MPEKHAISRFPAGLKKIGDFGIDVNSELPQGSPVSTILFLIYISGVFEAIETAVPGVGPLSFADDIGIVALGSSVDLVCRKLQQAGEAAIK